jgi:hypothetical protein
LHPIPSPLTRETLEAHHAGDYYRRHVATGVTFPYTAAAARAAYVKLTGSDGDRLRTETFFDQAHPSGSGILVLRLVDRLAQTARRRGARLAVMLIPSADRLKYDYASEEKFIGSLRQSSDVCFIDLKSPLREHARVLGGTLPTAPKGHYNVVTNGWIADVVAAGLASCGISHE